MLNAKLVVVGGDAKKTEVRLKLPTIIGRGKEAGLTVPHALVSRRHTELFERDGKLFVRDMGSLNGTYVNNTRIQDEQPLEPNQLLTLGNITFRAVYEIASGAASDTEDIAFEGIKTETADDSKSVVEVQLPSGEPQLSSLSDVMSFDETVPVDSIPSNHSVEVSKPETDTKAAEQVAASDTDKSFVHSETIEDGLVIGISGISLETDDVDPASRSVSASALGDLPAEQSAVSFAGGVDLGDQAKKPISQIDPSEIQLGEEKPKNKVDQDSSLGSFLRKLPR